MQHKTGLYWTALDCQPYSTQNWTPLDCQPYLVQNLTLLDSITLSTVLNTKLDWLNTLTTSPIIWLVLWLAFVPCVLATGSTTPFSDIPFQAFSQFILTTIHFELLLGTVLLVFFYLAENPDLLLTCLSEASKPPE